MGKSKGNTDSDGMAVLLFYPAGVIFEDAGGIIGYFILLRRVTVQRGHRYYRISREPFTNFLMNGF